MAVIASICSSDMLAIMSPMFFIMSGFALTASRALASVAASMPGGAPASTSGGISSSDSSAAPAATAAEALSEADDTSTPAAAAAARASASAAATLASAGASAAARARSATASASSPAASRAAPLARKGGGVSHEKRAAHAVVPQQRIPSVVAFERPLVDGNDGTSFGRSLGSSAQLQHAVRQVEHAHLAQLPPCASGHAQHERQASGSGVWGASAATLRWQRPSARLGATCPPRGCSWRAGTSPRPPQTCRPCSRSGRRRQSTRDASRSEREPYACCGQPAGRAGARRRT